MQPLDDRSDRVIDPRELWMTLPRAKPGWPALSLGTTGYWLRYSQRDSRRRRFNWVPVQVDGE